MMPNFRALALWLLVGAIAAASAAWGLASLLRPAGDPIRARAEEAHQVLRDAASDLTIEGGQLLKEEALGGHVLFDSEPILIQEYVIDAHSADWKLLLGSAMEEGGFQLEEGFLDCEGVARKARIEVFVWARPPSQICPSESVPRAWLQLQWSLRGKTPSG